MRIAMWSGPRNLSTAMMYAFGARPDFAVIDEPFYAAYLRATGIEHPMRNEVLQAQSHDPNKVIALLTGSNPAKMPHCYQKHMCQHMIPEIPRDWMREVVNIFLIRHPARVIASYAAKRENLTLEDIGFRQQAELFDEVCGFGSRPLVIDSHDIRDDPEGMLRKLCAALGLDFDPAMLSWPRGGHSGDGVWARYWYGAAHGSTGFAGAEGDLPAVPLHLHPVLRAAERYYEKLKELKL